MSTTLNRKKNPSQRRKRTRLPEFKLSNDRLVTGRKPGSKVSSPTYASIPHVPSRSKYSPHLGKKEISRRATVAGHPPKASL